MPRVAPYSAGQMRPIVRDALGIGAATGAAGLSYGALAVAAGLSVPQACALSLLMFTGRVAVRVRGPDRRRPDRRGRHRAAARRPQRAVRPAARAVRAPASAGRATRDRRVRGDGRRPPDCRRHPARLLVDRPRRVRVLERRDARRRPGRHRPERPPLLGPRRRRPGRVPRTARTAIERGGAAHGGRAGDDRGAGERPVRPGRRARPGRGRGGRDRRALPARRPRIPVVA